MKNLKDLINQWLNTNTEAHTARIHYYQKRHDLSLRITEYKLERASMVTSNWTQEDKDVIQEFYTNKIDKLSNDVYWLDLFYELNINCN